MKKISRIALLFTLIPIMVVAAVVGTLYVKDIVGGNGLENTTSSDEDPVRQQATTAIIVQKAPYTGRNPSNQFKIVYADGGSEVCSGVGLMSFACALVPGTLQAPNIAEQIGAGGGFFETYTCAITAFTPYGHYEITIVSGGGGEPVLSQFDFVADGYTAETTC